MNRPADFTAPILGCNCIVIFFRQNVAHFLIETYNFICVCTYYFWIIIYRHVQGTKTLLKLQYVLAQNCFSDKMQHTK